MSYRTTEQTESFKEAVKAVEAIDPPAIGFAKVTTGTATNQATIIKQNNLLLQLLTKVAEDVQQSREELGEIKRSLTTLLKQKEQREDTSEALEKLSKGLERIKIGGDPLVQKKKGPFYVFEDPKKIFEQEKAKLSK